MKKLNFIIITIIIVFLSLCFLLGSIKAPIAYADYEDMYENQGVDSYNVTGNQMMDATEKGKVTSTGDDGSGTPASSTDDIDVADDGWGGVGGFLTTILSVFAYILNWILTIAAGKASLAKGADLTSTQKFSIQNLLAGRYPLFDINYFGYVDKGTNGFAENDPYVNTKQDMAGVMAIWFVSLRNLSIIALVVVLIYVGIRMAIETAASEQARYKQMALYWLEGISLLVVLHYLIIFVLNIAQLVQEQLIRPLYSATIASVDGTGKAVFSENEMMENFWKEVRGGGSTNNKLYNLVLVYAFTYFQFKFFLLYFYRAIRVYFYIVISPLVCLTYPLDRLGDTRAQAFNKLTGMFIGDVIMQTYHCITYIAMIYTAGAIIQTIPILALVFVFMIGKVDKLASDALRVKIEGIQSVKINPIEMIPKPFGGKGKNKK